MRRADKWPGLGPPLVLEQTLCLQHGGDADLELAGKPLPLQLPRQNIDTV